MRVLLVTVGGSDVPIVQSIINLKPDKIIFLCSQESRKIIEGDGFVCGDYYTADQLNLLRPSIMAQTNYGPERTEILKLVDPNNPVEIYDLAVSLIGRYISNQDEVIVDYTSGTKSMSAGLWAASTEVPGCRFTIVKGLRKGLENIKENLSRVHSFPKNKVLLKRQFQLAKNLVSSQDYEGSFSLLERMGEVEGTVDDPTYEFFYFAAKAFSLWDHFEYKQALEMLNVMKKVFDQNKSIIKYQCHASVLVGTIEWYEKYDASNTSHHRVPLGLLLVYDVLFNARRCASKGRYDDAVARLYRATEMYAQFTLMSLGILTSNVSFDHIPDFPEDRKEFYESKRNNKGLIQTGLFEDYCLLKDCQHPVGEIWRIHKNKVTDALRLRNSSFLAHGLKPVSQSDYTSCTKTIIDFIKECDAVNPVAKNSKTSLLNALDLPDTFAIDDLPEDDT